MRAALPDRCLGFTSLEVVVAVAVFGVALSGLGATIISQLRMMQAIERRVYVLAPMGSTVEVVDFNLTADSFDYSQDTITEQTDILGATNPWAMQLGVAVLAARDGRRASLPATVSPIFSLSLTTPVAQQPSTVSFQTNP